MIKDDTAYQKVVKARTEMVLEQPFFASLALRLQIREDSSCQSAWTDGRVFAYNPEYVKILSSEKIKGLCSHTVMHPACAHHKRRNNRDHKTWNKACDYAINPILLDAGIILPDGFLYDESFCGKNADSVYTMLKQGEAKDSENSEAQDKTGEKSENPEQDKSLDPKNQEETIPGNTSDKEDASDEQGDPGLSGEVRDSEHKDGTSGDDFGTDWDQALVQAAASARSMGKLPRGIKRLVDSLINPKLCWQQLLARFIETNARSDYSWITPNRRFIYQGLYFPSLNNYELNEVAVAIDTSGSVQNEELAQFGAELSSIMETYPVRLHLVYCDMKVTGYQALEKWDLPIKFNPVGGGGTDFRPVFEFFEQQRISPACLVYLTDLECRYFPHKRPAYPVLWIQTGSAQKADPPFGSIVHLDITRSYD